MVELEISCRGGCVGCSGSFIDIFRAALVSYEVDGRCCIFIMHDQVPYQHEVPTPK
jgi:hypothetical protein